MKTLLLLLVILLTACDHRDNKMRNLPEASRDKNAAFSDVLEPGDCFIFTDSTLLHGLLLIKIEGVGKAKEYSFAPVKLDKSPNNIEQFLKGKVYVGQYTSLDNLSSEKGFPVIHILSEKDFNSLAVSFTKIGNLHIGKEFLNITGGTLVSNLSELKTLFAMHDQIFGSMAKEETIAALVEK